MNQSDVAIANIKTLEKNPYPGRGIIIGKQTDEKIIMISWIMGRSENSRNRVYCHDDHGRVYTEAADPTKMKDPSLIIYNAMDEANGTYVVSNGAQTDLVKQAGGSIEQKMVEHGFQYEPDAPNYTPRITGLYNRKNKCEIEMAMHRKSPFSDAVILSSFFYPAMELGYGRCLTTYTGDGNPLPAFEGEPFLVPIPTDFNLSVIAQIYRKTLNAENFVALAAKEINVKTDQSRVVVLNRFKQIVNPVG
jgi:hypothetical protein